MSDCTLVGQLPPLELGSIARAYSCKFSFSLAGLWTSDDTLHPESATPSTLKALLKCLVPLVIVILAKVPCVLGRIADRTFSFLKMMKLSVFRAVLQKNQVFYPIVQCVPVDVMNYFFRLQQSSNVTFHHQTMLSDVVTPGRCPGMPNRTNVHIAAVNAFPTSPSMVILRRSGGETTTKTQAAFSYTLDWFPAILTKAFHGLNLGGGA